MVKILVIMAFVILPIRDNISVGLASFYGKSFHGKTMANGEKFDQHKLTAASNQYELGTILKLWRVVEGDTLKTKVEVTDRMSTHYGKLRKLDLSRKAMAELRGIKEGVIQVHIQTL